MTPIPAIILARAGSKGVPSKNKRVIAGHPCWRWAALDADAAGCRTIVSSDDQDILESAIACGYKVVLRPSELATDTAKVEDAVRHACRAKGIDSGPVVVLYGCVPVRPKWLISSALAVLESTGADSVQSYCPAGKCHPWWTCAIDRDGTITPFVDLGHDSEATPASVPHRRQELLPLFIPDGGVIAIRDPEQFFGSVRQSVTTNPGDVIDIDTERDAMLAECVLRERNQPEFVPVDVPGYPFARVAKHIMDKFPKTMTKLAESERSEAAD